MSANTGDNLDFGGTSSTNIFFYNPNPVELLSAGLVNGRVEVVYRQKQHVTATINYTYPMSDWYNVWKEVYEVVDGEIKKTRRIDGRYVPPRNESYTFDEKDWGEINL